MDPSQDPSQPPANTPDAPDVETMERIRQRRFAKLGRPSTPKPEEEGSPSANPNDESKSSPQPPSADQDLQTPEPRRKINITPAPATQTSASSSVSETPLKQPSSSSASGSAPTDSAQKRAAAKIDERSPAAQPVHKKANMTSTESFEEYSDRVLSGIFRVTVDPDRTTDAQGHKLVFVEGLSQELKEDGVSLRLTKDRIDTALLEAASLRPHNTPLLNYLLPCFKRAVRALSTLKDSTGENREVLAEAKRLSVSYSLFALTLPDLFGRSQPDSLVQFLLRSYEREDALCLDFVKAAIDRFDEDEQYPALFADAMASMSKALSGLTMEQDYRPYLNAMTFYTRFPPLLQAVAQHENFLAGENGPDVEKNSILGPFFRLSPLQHQTLLTYFPNPRSLDRSRAAPSQETLRTILRVHQDELFAISNSFIRAGADTRSCVLDWFAKSINVNHKRRAIQVNPKEVSTDGFMINLTVVLDRFCSPFMDTTFSKVDRIEVDYFRRKPRVNIQDETKINADQATSDAFYNKSTDSKSSNFISEVFFLTLAAHHYGSGAASSKLKQLEREIKHWEKQIKAMEAERPKIQNVPHQLAVFEVSLKRYTDVLEKAIASKYAIEGVFMDEKMQELSLRFMRYVAVWMLRLASRTDYTPDKDLELPLPSPEPEAFSCLPEYALQDVVDNFKFVFRYLPQIMPSAVGSEMIALCVAFLESSQFVKNPYLKSSLVTLLFSGTWPFMHFKKGVLGDQLYGSEFANKHLLHALMKFYIEAESTGVNTAFYDKFNIRYEIFQVIKCVWGNDVYKQQLTRESKVNRQFFVQFVNLLLNDATYVLDEALTKFPKIHNIQAELEHDTNMSQQDREKKQEELQTLEGQATSYMQLANETLSMMKLFTSALVEAFTMPEIVSRLASMLNYNLDTLAGPKMGQLKVDDPQKYHFQPRVLLSDFVDIYINLGTSQGFVEAVAADGRSYKPETFEKAHKILEKRHMKDETDLGRLSRLMKKFKAAKALADQAELDLGEIPGEFEDPILGDLMRDPVTLPSQHIVDRSTIVQHLLSDPKDPFTRQPMTVDDAVPHTELKEKIDAWKAEKMSKIKETAMDTSED